MDGRTGRLDMLTFEQLEPALHKWARHFQCNDFEHWELINAVWAKEDVQKLKNIAYASARVKFDMIDYMRDYSKRYQESKGGFYPSTTLFSVIGSEETDFRDTLKAKQDFCRIESRDLFDILCEGLNRTQKLIMRLRYECDFPISLIGKVIGVTEARISQIHANILVQLKARLIDRKLSKSA